MFNLLARHAEAYSNETFQCHNCNRDFEAKVITWVDVTKTPRAKYTIINWDFNTVQCPHCGYSHFSGTPFFYEDFEEGLLLAVFPAIPEQRGEVEKSIREKYGYYPVLEFFYDMTQIWMLIHFQDNYRTNKQFRMLSRIGAGEDRLRKILHFLKEDALMITIREKLTETLLGVAAHDDLEDLLAQAACTLEQMLPWPLDAQCLCGADLHSETTCCGTRINMAEHGHQLSQRYDIYCATCKGSLFGAACAKCGRVYTWKLGTIPTFKQEEAPLPHKPVPAQQKPQPHL